MQIIEGEIINYGINPYIDDVFLALTLKQYKEVKCTIEFEDEEGVYEYQGVVEIHEIDSENDTYYNVFIGNDCITTELYFHNGEYVKIIIEEIPQDYEILWYYDSEGRKREIQVSKDKFDELVGGR